MGYKNIHAADGKLVFRYDPQRNLTAIKRDGQGWMVIDLELYQQAAPDVTQDAASEESPQ